MEVHGESYRGVKGWAVSSFNVYGVESCEHCTVGNPPVPVPPRFKWIIVSIFPQSWISEIPG